MTSQQHLTIALLIGTPGTTWGGMEKHTADLAGALASRGHCVHVIAHPSYRDRFPGAVHFHPAPLQLGRRNPWLNFVIRRRITKILPDVLHAQGNKAAQLVGSIRSDIVRLRVGTVHGIKSSHKAFNRMDKVIAVSPQIFKVLQHPCKQLIYNGIALSGNLSPEQIDMAAVPGNTLNVIAIGRLEPVKGFQTLIKAWAMRTDSLPQAHLTLFGDGSERKKLEQLISELGLDDVTLAGFRTDLNSIYKRAQLTVISSEREGFPYVLIESLLAGCPVISTPVSGPQNLLPAQALSQDHEPGSLADLLSATLGNLTALKKAEEPAIAFARDKLTLENMTDETEKLYFDALAVRQNTRN
ncbi:glycosyl transferase [Marinobacter salinus]|uniref:Glycosyl transferase n=1 Tax=Marinobacter salinus TaxID=1874317 RepID=A0A1D9GMT9_9GAMM|nr:glycosyltransferase [Marinobacter salinus]AOY88851.1 glycosyl transferase [Marinobacter salinus]